MLNKLYYVFGLDTACFYTDAETIQEYKLNALRQIKNSIVNKAEDKKDEKFKTEKKILTDSIGEQKNGLKEMLADNVGITRTARYDKLYDGDGQPRMAKRVAVFDSVLTRSLEMQERQFNEQLLIIKVYYFDVAKSIVEHGFYLNGRKYVFFSSSAGQIRTKKLVAVREDLLNANWQKFTAGLTVDSINKHGGINLNYI